MKQNHRWKWVTRGLDRISGAWRGGGKRNRDRAIHHLRSGEVFQKPPGNEFVYLLLSGICESPENGRPRFEHGDALFGMDPDAGDQPGKSVRAIMDSVILRISREDLRRIAGERRGVGKTPSGRSWQLLRSGSGKLICLSTLCDEFAESTESIARTIRKETGDSILWIKINGGADACPMDRWRSRTPGDREGVAFLELKASDDRRALAAMETLLEHYKERFSYVFVEVGRHAPMEILLECVRQSFCTYLFLRQSTGNLFEFSLLAKETRTRGIADQRIKLLVCLNHDEVAHGLSRYIEETNQTRVHSYLRMEKDALGKQWNASLRRLGREICNRRVGLALSSGAARGLSHIGVLQVLEENGIEVDAVSGSSMGSYVTAVWGKGYNGHEMEKFARELQGYRGMWRLMDIAMPPLRGFLYTGRVRKRLEKTIGASHFSDMERPIRIVATRLDTLERVVFSGGDVVDAVLASIAIPGVCVPVTLDGVTYVDGGLCDPLPVDALLEIGIRRIIAVNTIATPETLRACLELSGSAIKAAPRFSLNPFASGNAFDTMMRSIHAAQTRIAESACRKASVVLRPYSVEGRWHDFGNPSLYIQLGRQVTEASLPEIRSLFLPSHEDKPPQLADAA